jgi:hypothetical protein
MKWLAERKQAAEDRHEQIQFQEFKRGEKLKNSIRLQAQTSSQHWET